MSVTVEQIAEAGVVGAGGAGFPTHVKLSATADTVVINAAECEPLLHKDKELLRNRTRQFVNGLQQAMQLVGASCGVVGIKKKYTETIEIVRSQLLKNMIVAPLDDAYPSGDEFILVYEAIGRVIPPGQIPLAVGAIVLNAETTFNIAAIADGVNVTEKWLTVAGDVRRPISLRVPIGAPLSACLAAAGGTTISNPRYVIGGAMMGYLESDLSKPVAKTTGGIIVLPDDHFIVRRKSWDWKKTARIGMAACDQCSYCTELCPRNLLGHPIEPHRAMRSIGFSLSRQSDVPGTQFCCECNLCSYCSCPEGLDPRGVCAENKKRILSNRQRWENPPFRENRAANMMRNRKTPTSRLMQKIGLSRFENHAPLHDELLEVPRVEILLRQHIGAACQPIVNVGDRVAVGQTIAKRPVADGKTALGADLHASIDGTVAAVTEISIVIDVA
ncbi:MAG: SLBB domain-containing protein [Planctomycetaceae bacterium]|jgi:Na+-translocating ferredoxin:NAD+ oxidoreductase RnfC subunit|nr:SLBB domain-containing protein [Planctomycetaceae bacterium]